MLKFASHTVESGVHASKTRTCYVMRDASGNAVTDAAAIAKVRKSMYENFDDRVLCDAKVAKKANSAIGRIRCVLLFNRVHCIVVLQ